MVPPYSKLAGNPVRDWTEKARFPVRYRTSSGVGPRIESRPPMGPVSADISIDASRDDVFDFICDLGRRPAWIDHFASDYRLERVEPAGEGAAARFRAGAPGGLEQMDTVITRAERPHRIDEHGRGGRLNRIGVRTVWELEGGEGSPTEVRVTFWTEPPSFFHRLRELRAPRWWRRRWKRALRRLREQLESPQGGAPPVALAGANRQPVTASQADAAHDRHAGTAH